MASTFLVLAVVFRLLQSSLCICVVCKCICVVSRVLVCYFFVRGHLVASFFFGGFEIGDLRSFPCFASFIFIVLLVLPLFGLVCTKCFGCDFVSGCVLVYDWFANILVDVLKLRWHCWLHFDISFNVRVWLSISWRSCYCPPVICPLIIYCFYCWYYFFVDGYPMAIYPVI